MSAYAASLLPQLQNLFASGRLEQYSRGEIIQRPGEQPRCVYFIESGFVKVYNLSEQGIENLHVIYKTGELFPLVAGIKNMPRTAFCEAISPVRLRSILLEEFLLFAKTHVETAFCLLEQLADQCELYVNRIDNLQYSSAADRVAYRLLLLAARFGKERPEGVLIAAPITHQLLASSLNLARETVSRELEKLEQAGLLVMRDRRLILADLTGLRAQLALPSEQLTGV